jgi:hypothetical protein
MEMLAFINHTISTSVFIFHFPTHHVWQRYHLILVQYQQVFLYFISQCRTFGNAASSLLVLQEILHHNQYNKLKFIFYVNF